MATTVRGALSCAGGYEPLNQDPTWSKLLPLKMGCGASEKYSLNGKCAATASAVRLRSTVDRNFSHLRTSMWGPRVLCLTQAPRLPLSNSPPGPHKHGAQVLSKPARGRHARGMAQ